VYEKTWSLILLEEHRQIESVLEQGKVKLSHYRPGQTLRAPGDLRLTEFLNNRHMKMVRLSALRIDRLNTQEISIAHICQKVGQLQSHSATEGLSQSKIPVIPPGIEPVENRVLRRILGPMRCEVVGGCKNCIMRNFIICDIHHLRLK
jgi:hypothetical protein